MSSVALDWRAANSSASNSCLRDRRAMSGAMKKVNTGLAIMNRIRAIQVEGVDTPRAV